MSVWRTVPLVQVLGRQFAPACRKLSDWSACKVEESVDLSKAHTVVCPSGVIACWHPEKPFPYEHSKPIDLEKLEKEKQSSGVLSKETERIAGLQGSLAQTGPRNHMLREIFYTGKHEWKTRQREDRLHSVAAPDPKRKK